MPISFALLLGIPIGAFFYFIGWICFRFMIGRFGFIEHRLSLLAGLFGICLVPTIWILGCLSEEFPTISYQLISFAVFTIEILILFGISRLLLIQSHKSTVTEQKLKADS